MLVVDGVGTLVGKRFDLYSSVRPGLVVDEIMKRVMRVIESNWGSCCKVMGVSISNGGGQSLSSVVVVQGGQDRPLGRTCRPFVMCYWAELLHCCHLGCCFVLTMH